MKANIIVKRTGNPHPQVAGTEDEPITIRGAAGTTRDEVVLKGAGDSRVVDIRHSWYIIEVCAVWIYPFAVEHQCRIEILPLEQVTILSVQLYFVLMVAPSFGCTQDFTIDGEVDDDEYRDHLLFVEGKPQRNVLLRLYLS